MDKKNGEFLQGLGYRITDVLSPVTYEYIYQNRDILLRVDKYGLAYAQSYPPKDIVLFKRADSEKFSKWHVWVKCGNDGYVSNFSFPRNREPISGEIEYLPHAAYYRYDYGTFSLSTEIMVPFKGAAAVMSVTVTNKTKDVLSFEVMPALYPHINHASMSQWDKTEWYLKTSAAKASGYVEFMTRLNSSACDPKARRLVTFQACGVPSVELRMEDYCGNGVFDRPDAFQRKELPFNYSDLSAPGVFDDELLMQGYPPVYACKYNVEIKAGESKTFTQVLNMQSLENLAEYSEKDAKASALLLDENVRAGEIGKHKKFFEDWFSRCTIRTNDSEFDNYINTFLSLQMYWVACLDRGWPSGMRGVRDASNDFMGVLKYDEAWAEQILLQLFSCQRKDGWMPRQISDESRKDKHDLRPYVDGGAFLIEFLYEFLATIDNMDILSRKLPWLDDDNESTLYDHFLQAIEYYLAPDNIGEHGLCKIRGGDWLDAVAKAGLEGRGEGVTVTCQTIINLGYACEIVSAFAKDKKLCSRYESEAMKLKAAVRKHALNKKGFVNSIFTDGGDWLFSDNDPDGECRIYGPANYYAVIAGVFKTEELSQLWKNVEGLKCESGYRLFSPGLGKKPIDCAGRIASGDMPVGLWENGTVYNHGSQGFLIRALAAAGEGDKLSEVMRYMLPYDQEAHPIEKTKSAPYAILNCYQDLPLNRHRGGSAFLTGTTAMAVRAVYNWMFGIRPVCGGICIKPCLPMNMDGAVVNIRFNDKNLEIKYQKSKDGILKITLNGNDVFEKYTDPVSAINIPMIKHSDLKKNNKIIVQY